MPYHRAPDRYQQIQNDQVAIRDRAFFILNPDRRFLVRLADPSELDSIPTSAMEIKCSESPAEGCFVIVMKVADNLLLRIPAYDRPLGPVNSDHGCILLLSKELNIEQDKIRVDRDWFEWRPYFRIVEDSRDD